MIISYSKNFIFMHSRKTAGSSITAALNQYLAKNDIQLGAWPDTIATGGQLNRLVRKIAFRSPLITLLPSLKYSLKTSRLGFEPYSVNEAVRLKYYKSGLLGGTHSSATNVRQFDPEHWQRSFKFGFVRNPWDHAISDFHWRRYIKKNNTVNFKEFVLRLQDSKRPDPEQLRPPIVTNWSIYSIDNTVEIDYMARYENLHEEIEIISKKLHLPINLKTFKSKASIRTAKKPVFSYYDEETTEIIRSVYRREIEEFNYAPPW